HYRCCAPSAERNYLFVQPTPSKGFVEVYEKLGQPQRPCNSCLTCAFATLGIRKIQGKRPWQGLTKLPGPVRCDGCNTDGVEATTQKDTGSTVMKAAIDRPLEDLIEAGGLLSRKPTNRLVLGYRIPVTLQPQAPGR